MSEREEAHEVAVLRRDAALFRLDDRGLIEVGGEDRVRWLDGMVSNDVASLQPGAEHSGCYAVVLTPKGLIVSDLQVMVRGEVFWLETARHAVAKTIERLSKYIVADDVNLVDRTDEIERLGLEGPAAAGILEQAIGSDPGLAPDACCQVELAGAPLLAARFGWSGELAYQLFVPKAEVERERVAQVLHEAAGARGVSLVDASAGALEIARIEAGIPRLGCELGDDVFPDEARLDRAISTNKGCYTGQEIVARLRSRGQVNHLLVGLRFSGDELPAPDAELSFASRPTGEVTSSCTSPRAGNIGLGYVRRAHAEAGTELSVGAATARVVDLPIAPAGVAAD